MAVYSLDTNANSGASGSATLGAKSFGGNHTQGIPAWAIVVIALVVAVVLIRTKKGS